MKTMAFIILGVLLFSADRGKKEDTNPYLPEQHIATQTGYLHPFPCHAGEGAQYDGCYEVDWYNSHREEVKSGNCRIDSQNVLICQTNERN